MINVDEYQASPWPDELRPEGHDTLQKEGFARWWARVGPQLANLHPTLCEQWLHRHWKQSPAAFLSLDRLTWRLERMTTAAIVEQVHREWAKVLDPEFDYKTFHGDGSGKHPTARALDLGAWDYPIIVLETPEGIRNRREKLPDVRLMLIEGHQRHRYLAARYRLGKEVVDQDVFVLSLAQPLPGTD
jgi:hypothetical protein